MSITGSFSSGEINISSVTGDIVITATASMAVVTSISATYTQPGTVYDNASLDSLKDDLVVMASYDNGITDQVFTYALSGTLEAGTSTITVSYGGQTTTFNVTVTEYVPLTVSVTWSGAGSDKTASPTFDATGYDVYYTLPYVSGASQLSSSAVDGGNAIRVRADLYSDAGSTLVGYYYMNTQTIETSTRTWANTPILKFGVKAKVAPKGYYVKLKLSNNLGMFADNNSCTTYLNNNGKTVVLE